MKKSLLAFSLALALASAQARADGLPHSVRVFQASRSRLSMRDLGSDALSRNWVKVRATPPHRLVNPLHQTFLFEGPELRSLLRGPALASARYVYAVGADGYVTMIPADIIRRYGVILGIKRDGLALAAAAGEQQVIFPSDSGAPLPALYRGKSAFWIWYVRTFVVGELPNVLSVGGRQVSMREAAHQGTPREYVPPSLLRVGDPSCPPVREVPLAEVPGLSSVAKVSAQSLYKDIKSISPAGGYRLLRTSSATAIPIECGGPFILVKPERVPVRGKYGPDDLIYLVFGIDPAS